MPNVLILCAHRPKRSPSQRYRFEQYLPFLQNNNLTFTFSYLLNEKDDTIFYGKGNIVLKFFILLKSIFIRLNDARRFKNFDIIFIQREAFMTGSYFFEKQFRKSKSKIIFGLGASPLIRAFIISISFSGVAIGLVLFPTKPTTPLIPFSECQTASL